MKGTLFSADFIKDSQDNLRLLELNTDTGIIQTALPYLDLTNLLSVLESNSITKVTAIGKPIHHSDFINFLSSSISENLPQVVEFTTINESLNTIYPTSVADESDRFILRLAYDESALFDSEYCKNNLSALKLFVDRETPEAESVISFYHSSSEEGSFDFLDRTLNDGLVPDLASKDILNQNTLVKFIKFGSEVEGESDLDIWNNYITNHYTSNDVISKYHYNSSSMIDGKISSYRNISIIYGNNLDLIDLGSYKTHATFELPISLDGEYNSNSYVNELDKKHYYEFATNFIKFEGNFHGLLSTHELLKGDGTYSPISEIQIGDTLASYYISGSPDSELDTEIFGWSSNGNQLPSGSFLTSSLVITKNTQDLQYGALNEITVDGDSIYTSTKFSFLVYDSGSDSISYKTAIQLNPTNDYFIDTSGSLIDIDEANIYITSDNATLTEIDIEDTDTYIISGSTSFNSVVAHNSPCFVAGTKITLEDGNVKNIEDVLVGDVVLTYNHSTNETEYKLVEQVISKHVDSTVKVIFDNNIEIQCTLDHPLYSVEMGYVSFNPLLTKQQYGLDVKQLEIGTSILLEDGSSSLVVSLNKLDERVLVYNLNSVKDNHNFFANKMLVHNRCFVAGTEITMADGDVKNIENVVVDDEVLTYNEETGENEMGIVGDLKQHEVDSVIRLTLDNENIIITTHEHPFFVEGKGWIKAGELQPLDVCKKVDGSESLISTVEVLEETHTVYNLLSVSENHNFFANGILVHNKL